MRYYTLGVLLLLVGCSAGSSPTYPVSGIVKLSSGKPLSGGQVLFQPLGENSAPAKGIINSDGTFELTTFTAGDGAVPGSHKVTVTPSVPQEVLDHPAAVLRYRSLVDRRYQNIQTTPLEFAVKEDGSNHFEIVVEGSGDREPLLGRRDQGPGHSRSHSHSHSQSHTTSQSHTQSRSQTWDDN